VLRQKKYLPGTPFSTQKKKNNFRIDAIEKNGERPYGSHKRVGRNEKEVPFLVPNQKNGKRKKARRNLAALEVFSVTCKKRMRFCGGNWWQRVKKCKVLSNGGREACGCFRRLPGATTSS